MSPWKLRQARYIVNGGGVIAYPTEAVYGLGCDPLQETAVRRILQLKHRPPAKGLIIIAARVEQILEFVEFNDAVMADRVMATWPGPVTWLLPASPAVPPWIHGQYSTVAVRISRHPLVQALCRITGPLVSTSANPARYRPARSAHRVISYFGNSVDLVIHGAVGSPSGQPTEIRDASTGRIIRQGG